MDELEKIKIQAVVDDLRKQYTCGDSPLGYDAFEEGYSPEERMEKAAKDLTGIINLYTAKKSEGTGHYFDCSKGRTGVCDCGYGG